MEKSSEITSHAEEGKHTRKRDSLAGKMPQAFIFFNERHESHVCPRAQHGNNSVDFNSINPLHLSLYHINTCHLRWVRLITLSRLSHGRCEHIAGLQTRLESRVNVAKT